NTGFSALGPSQLQRRLSLIPSHDSTSRWCLYLQIGNGSNIQSSRGTPPSSWQTTASSLFWWAFWLGHALGRNNPAISDHNVRFRDHSQQPALFASRDDREIRQVPLAHPFHNFVNGLVRIR